MSLFETTQIPAANPKLLKQIKGESLRDYQMFLDYCTHKDLNKLSKKYNLQVRQLFNIKEKNSWKQRMENLEQQCSNAFLIENYSKLYKHNIQKRENLLDLSINIQDRLSKFMEDLSNAPLSREENYIPTQQELIKSFRQETRALLEIEKLAQIVDDQLKKINIDLSPESLAKFELNVILGDEMLNYFPDFDEKTNEENPDNEQFLPIANSAMNSGDVSLLTEVVCEPKQKETAKIPTPTLAISPIENPQLTQEELDLEKEIELGLKEIQENLKQIHENFKTMPNFTQPILTNHKNKANSKLVKKIKSFSK